MLFSVWSLNAKITFRVKWIVVVFPQHEAMKNTLLPPQMRCWSIARLPSSIWSGSPDNYSLYSDDKFRSGCRNVSHHYRQKSFSELHSPGRSNYTITRNFFLEWNDEIDRYDNWITEICSWWHWRVFFCRVRGIVDEYNGMSRECSSIDFEIE